MHPILLKLNLASGIFQLNAYSFFMFLAALAVFSGSYFFSVRRGLPARSVMLILFSMLVSVFIGARFLHILLNLELYKTNPERIYAFDTLGFSLYGGIVAALIIGLVVGRIMKMNIWRMGDSVVPFLGIGIALMRIGCYLNGCCFGKETDLPWGVTFPILSQAHKHQLAQGSAAFFGVNPVHPTELYELIAALVGSIIAILIIKKKLPDGAALLIFGIWFSLFRLFDNFLRVPSPTFDAPLLFYPLFYSTLIILGIIFLRLKLKNRDAIL